MTILHNTPPRQTLTGRRLTSLLSAHPPWAPAFCLYYLAALTMFLGGPLGMLTVWHPWQLRMDGNLVIAIIVTYGGALAFKTVGDIRLWRNAAWLLDNTSTSFTTTLESSAFQEWLNRRSGQGAAAQLRHFQTWSRRGKQEIALMVLCYRRGRLPSLWTCQHLRLA